MNIEAFWQTIGDQDERQLQNFFHPQAIIRWHNTNETFNVIDFIKANCTYPGSWKCIVERVETLDSLIITVTKVREMNDSLSFHVTSFIQLDNDKIVSLDEYWGDDGVAPQWRQDLKIGQPIE